MVNKRWEGSAFQIQWPLSQEGPKRGNPGMTTSTGTARRKGERQHMLRERDKMCIQSASQPSKTTGLDLLRSRTVPTTHPRSTQV